MEGRGPLSGEAQDSGRELLPARPSPKLLTLAGGLDGDFLAAVAPASGGDGCHPQQVLLPAVQVGNPVEELLGTGLVLARRLWGRAKGV